MTSPTSSPFSSRGAQSTPHVSMETARASGNCSRAFFRPVIVSASIVATSHVRVPSSRRRASCLKRWMSVTSRRPSCSVPARTRPDADPRSTASTVVIEGLLLKTPSRGASRRWVLVRLSSSARPGPDPGVGAPRGGEPGRARGERTPEPDRWLHQRYIGPKVSQARKSAASRDSVPNSDHALGRNTRSSGTLCMLTGMRSIDASVMSWPPMWP